MLLLQLTSSIFPAIIFFKELSNLSSSLPVISCQLTFAINASSKHTGPKQQSILDIVILIYFALDEEGTECSATLARKVTGIYFDLLTQRF